MNNEYFEILMDGQIIHTTRLGGIAFLMLQSAMLVNNNSKLVRHFDDPDDQVLHSPKVYNIECGSWDEFK